MNDLCWNGCRKQVYSSVFLESLVGVGDMPCGSCENDEVEVYCSSFLAAAKTLVRFLYPFTYYGQHRNPFWSFGPVASPDANQPDRSSYRGGSARMWTGPSAGELGDVGVLIEDYSQTNLFNSFGMAQLAK